MPVDSRAAFQMVNPNSKLDSFARSPMMGKLSQGNLIANCDGKLADAQLLNLLKI